jgi:hypothetical protein
MATTFEWKIPSMEYYPTKDELDKVVHVIHWILNGTDDEGHKGSTYGSQSINTDTIDPETFVPFDELTFEVVEGWLESAIGSERILELHTLVQTNIDNQKSPPNVLATSPWA